VAEVRLRERAMAFALSGWLVHGTWREPVAFPTVLGLGSSQATVESEEEGR
jgi:predicted component of type VI protein secretion system